MCGKRGVCVESVWLTEGGCGVPHPSGHQRSGTRSPGRRSGPIESRRLFPSCNASSDGFPRAGESLRVAPAQGLGLLTAGSGTRSPSRSGSQADAASTRAGPLTRPASLRAPRHRPGGRSESPVGATGRRRFRVGTSRADSAGPGTGCRLGVPAAPSRRRRSEAPPTAPRRADLSLAGAQAARLGGCDSSCDSETGPEAGSPTRCLSAGARAGSGRIQVFRHRRQPRTRSVKIT